MGLPESSTGHPENQGRRKRLAPASVRRQPCERDAAGRRIFLAYSFTTCRRSVTPSLHALPQARLPPATNSRLIDEYVGRVNSETSAVSVAHMRSLGGWREPGQTPDFEEFTVVLRGVLRVQHRDGTLDVHAGQPVISHGGEWVRHSTPEADGAEYIAVCVPAFSMDTVHRDS
jgi:ethanolamine utilization protein EutQ